MIFSANTVSIVCICICPQCLYQSPVSTSSPSVHICSQCPHLSPVSTSVPSVHICSQCPHLFPVSVSVPSVHICSQRLRTSVTSSMFSRYSIHSCCQSPTVLFAVAMVPSCSPPQAAELVADHIETYSSQLTEVRDHLEALLKVCVCKEHVHMCICVCLYLCVCMYVCMCVCCMYIRSGCLVPYTLQALT